MRVSDILKVKGNTLFTVTPDTPLLDVLRNHLGLVGSKFGCGADAYRRSDRPGDDHVGRAGNCSI